MCGIAGIIGPGAGGHRAALDRMLASLHHRGPDDRWVVEADGALIGATRLAVIDPEHGQQPLVDDQGVIVAGNGEIYGYQAVRKSLGLAPEGGSDLNVVAPLWHRHGHQLLEHLPGTFSLVLHDPRTATTMLARDPFGERPLYWADLGGGDIAFASDPAALLDAGLVERSVDRGALAEVVRTGYVPPGSCIWEGMRSLPPGHLLSFTGVDGPVERRWWHPPAVDESIELADAIPWFRQALRGAVEEQLVADVPVGLWLSGGLDSATVAGLAASVRTDSIVAFCFDVPGASEVGWARAIADRHGLDLRICGIDDLKLADDLIASAQAWSEPLGDSSTLLTWLLARRTREEVTVALTGDGADELLGGYAPWSGIDLEPRARRRRAWGLPRRSPTGGANVAAAYAGFRSHVGADQLAELGLPPCAADVDRDAYATGTVEDICRFDLGGYLPGDILVKSDRASMAHGLEVRAPFLDRTVAEGCLTLPAECKLAEGRHKVVLREAFGHLWPDGLADRPKQGFGAPLDRWLRSGPIAELAEDLLGPTNASVYDLVDREAARALRSDGGQPAWTLLATALWWEHHRRAPAP